MGKKAPKTTPRTTAINPQAVAHTLTAFSPAGAQELYYAHLHAAPDAHTLRVYSLDGKCVSRWASNAHGDGQGDDSAADEPRVRSIEWCTLPASSTEDAVAQQQAEGKRGKKRRKSDGGGAVDSPAKPTLDSLRPTAPQALLALGLESGSVLLWQPTGTQGRTLSHPASNSPVTALAAPVGADAAGHLWSAHADGSVRVWDVESGNVLGKVAGLAEEPRWDDLLVRYESASAVESGKRTVQLVLSHLSLHVYTLQLAGASKKEGKVRDLKATELGRCTGHVEPCSVQWTGAVVSPAGSSTDDALDKLTFLSYAPTDRFVQIWQIPTGPSSSPHIGLLLARLALDSGVASAAVSPLSSASSSSQTLGAIDATTGNVSLTTLPISFSAESATPSKKGKKHGLGVVALETQSEITAPAQGGRNEANVSAVAFRPEEDGKIVLCRGGVKPVFEVVSYKEEGAFLNKVELARGAAGLLSANGAAGSSSGAPQPTRYSEQSTSAVAATTVTADADSDDDEVIGNAGELDVDMAEPTLADRLKALNVSQKKERKAAAKKQRALDAGADVDALSESDDDEDDDEDDFAGEDDELDGPAVPATTLTTTLIQALHSQDGPLLESCLTHSNPNLVRSTVKRLPSGGLVLSLLEALVERLGKQKKGREGMASVRRARALIAWLRETLIVHVGFLVTIPSLVNRLAALHASLTQRLALQPTLLALNGRLDLVMSQIDLRQDRARAASQRQLAAAATKKSTGGRRYVEGESSDDDEPQADDDEDLSEGDIEDVVLGGGGDSDESGSGEEDDEISDVDSDFEDEEDGENGAPRHKRNGVESLLDLEAEDDEDFDEDEEDSEEAGSDDGEDESDGEDSEFEA